MDNSLYGAISPSFFNLSHLLNLDLSYNNFNFSKISNQFANLKYLTHLDLSYTFSGSISTQFANLSSLRYLDVSCCDDDFVSGGYVSSTDTSWLRGLANLKELRLSSVDLNSTIPIQLSNLTSLSILDLKNCQLQAGSLSYLPPQLEEVYMRDNPDLNPDLSINLSLISNASLLNHLDAGNCSIQGSLSSMINLSQLEYLDLNSNNITGSIPSCLFNNLWVLDLSSNILEGTIPPSFSILTSLTNLDLSGNNLQGHLPLPPQGCIVFDLSKNKFTGGISTKLGYKLSKIYSVSLSYNKSSGSIPSSICSNESSPRYLDLSNNELHGTIPYSLPYCRSLTYLNLGYNNFSGSIPTFIGSLNNLIILFLRSNKFNGSIPKEITHLHRLQILDLSTNNLSGPIPVEIGSLQMLTSRPNDSYLIQNESTSVSLQLPMVIKGTLIHVERLYNYNSEIDLSCNNLEGNIPEEICLLKGLPMLNLSHNYLSGKIPTRIENMTGLESLDLSFNKLSGDIPQSLASMDFLQKLNLSYNNLSGKIPKGFHLETLSGDNGSTYFGNYWLCGPPTNKSCHVESSLQEDDHAGEDGEDEDASEKWLLFGIVFLSFGVGFWGLFLVLLIKKEKWWFGFWKGVDNIAARITECIR